MIGFGDMSQAQRIAALEVSSKRRAKRPSPAAVIVCLAHAEPDAATQAQAEAWAKLPARERRQRAPWGILALEV